MMIEIYAAKATYLLSLNQGYTALRATTATNVIALK